MRLTTHTDFALRTLMFLATSGQRSTVAEVSSLFGISANHLAKVVLQLSRLGYVRSLRGIGGGIELARKAESIRLGELIETLEGNMHLLECVSSENVCAIQPFCKLKGVLAEAERLQLEYLNSMTLRDIVPTRRQLGSLAMAKVGEFELPTV
jgi:Rrf2 family transcriptional regulator, nitric oxide-sensitive transcriptional repressor